MDDARRLCRRPRTASPTFSLELGDLLLDWSKCAVTGETMTLLAGLAETADVDGRRDAMLRGDTINVTEHRAVLHTALRNRRGNGSHRRRRRRDAARCMRCSPPWRLLPTRSAPASARGATGKTITDIVNIGIGGSDLGPAMATLALAPYHDGPRAHYVSNVDGAHIA